MFPKRTLKYVALLDFRMKYLLLLSLILVAGCFSEQSNYQAQEIKKTNMENQTGEKLVQQKIVLVSLGDSYSFGEGAGPNQSWPFLLASDLRSAGYEVELVNPAVSGFTTVDVIENELPVLQETKPALVTLLIGANDLAQGMDRDAFRSNFSFILESIDPGSKIVVMTIPDFSSAEVLWDYHPPKIRAAIESFNSIIVNEAKKRNATVVDLFSLNMTRDMFSSDGFHPSAKGYAFWNSQISPVVVDLIRQ